ncbi:MAG: CsbD family protein [Burkholderiaceae bacterium]
MFAIARTAAARAQKIHSFVLKPAVLPPYVTWEQAMGMNKDQVKGRVKEVKGTIKEAAGKLVGNEKLQVKGKSEKALGEVQAKFGDVKKDVRDAVKSA